MLQKFTENGVDDLPVHEYLSDQNPLIKYWCLVQLQTEEKLPSAVAGKVLELLEDPDPLIGITAAETILQFQHSQKALKVISEGLYEENLYLLLMSARAFELMENKSASFIDAHRDRWLELKELTSQKWKGYDLYACWALNAVYE